MISNAQRLVVSSHSARAGNHFRPGVVGQGKTDEAFVTKRDMAKKKAHEGVK